MSDVRIINPVIDITDEAGTYGVGLTKALQVVIDGSRRRRVDDTGNGFKMVFIDLDYSQPDEQRQIGALLNSQPERLGSVIAGLRDQLQLAGDEAHAKAWAKQISYYSGQEEKYQVAGIACLPFRRWASRDGDGPTQAGTFFGFGIPDLNDGRGIKIYGKTGVQIPEPDTTAWQMVVVFLGKPEDDDNDPQFGLAVAVPDPEMIQDAVSDLNTQLKAVRDFHEHETDDALDNGNGAELGRIKAQLKQLRNRQRTA